jgi:hypothetical protein
MTRALVTSLLATFLAFFACDTSAEGPQKPNQEHKNSASRPAGPAEVAQLAGTYRWIDRSGTLPPLSRLADRFPAPEGLERVDVQRGSFAEFLRGLPVRLDRTHVESFKGGRLGSPSAAVVYLDVGDKNLQQCADSAIRLHAEWLWAAGKADKLRYHFTSGDPTAWSDWAAGERFRIAGSKVERRQTQAVSQSRANFREWLYLVFTYAGTRSLARDSESVDLADVQGGDFFVAPGSPGHAVVVLDVAEDARGQRYALLGQGFMPAQDFHVIEGSGPDVIDDVWWKLSPGKPVDTPSWKAFSPDSLRRFD